MKKKERVNYPQKQASDFMYYVFYINFETFIHMQVLQFVILHFQKH